MPLLALTVMIGWGCTPDGGHAPAAGEAGRPPAPDEVPEILSIELETDAAPFYRARQTSDDDSPLANSIRRRFPRLAVDGCLLRAARAHLEVPAGVENRMPLAFTEFALHWAGCPDPSATVGLLRSNETGAGVMLDYLTDLVASDSYTHVGVARGAAAVPYRSRWIILLVNRRFSLEPAPSSGDPGGNLALQFRVDPQFTGASIVVTDPAGSTWTVDPGVSGGLVVAGVPLSSRPGRQWVELVGHGPSGPQVLALFPVAIGRDPPRAWVGRVRPDETWIATAEQAESFAGELVQQTRDRFDLPRLERDQELDAVARAHSRDMAAAGYFAHVSPTTGSVVDRLEARGYSAFSAAENIAMGPSLGEAQDSLMRSPGHRAAILDTRSTHFGVGVAITESQEYGRVYILTQVFVTRPAVRDPN